MGRLLLLRHAKAGWARPGERDFDRRLDETGQSDAKAMGNLLKAQSITPGQVLCSTARRARDTWAAVGDALGSDIEATLTDDLYSTDAAGYLELIRRTAPCETLMLIGHNPMIEDLALALASGDEAYELLNQGFPTSGLAVFDVAGDWAEAATGQAHLQMFIGPADF